MQPGRVSGFDMVRLRLQRTGGIGGFGIPGSRVVSQGEVDMDALSTMDRRVVEALFQKKSRDESASLHRDGFSYRLSRLVEGNEEVITITESELPQVLRECIHDEFVI